MPRECSGDDTPTGDDDLAPAIERAAAAVRAADALLITAGAGMGVDSGLPDFRGNAGFWKAYPPFARLGLTFVQLANPVWFARDPQQAWGFYGHRHELYHRTEPHAGFSILLRWALARPCGYFVFTSNVDGHFQRAGFDERRVVECHGSIHHRQCSLPCDDRIWLADDPDVSVNVATMRASEPLPHCTNCGAVARPNVLMFGDHRWLSERTDAQHAAYRRWLEEIDDARLVVVELGAGLAVPTVRYESEQRAGILVRINPREPEVPSGGICLPGAARAMLQRIDALL
jgi:NAD-dependent SIR2 family protein deacetylase